MNIYQKIVEIRKTIEGFSKDTKGYNYSYVSGSQVLGKIKDKMEELQVILVPSIDYGTVTTDIKEWDMIDGKTGKEKHVVEYIIKGAMTYTWINAENPEEKITTPWMIAGQQDDISKAFGSALTYSERYYLLKFFNLPTDSEDPDVRQETKQYTQKGISDKQIVLAYNIATDKGLQNNQLDWYVMKEFNKELKSIQSGAEFNGLLEKIKAEDFKKYMKK